MPNADWFKKQGFASFTVVQDKHLTYEDRPVSQAGIRIEICEDVASVWCPVLGANHLAISSDEVQTTVELMPYALGRLKK